MSWKVKESYIRGATLGIMILIAVVLMGVAAWWLLDSRSDEPVSEDLIKLLQNVDNSSETSSSEAAAENDNAMLTIPLTPVEPVDESSDMSVPLTSPEEEKETAGAAPSRTETSSSIISSVIEESREPILPVFKPFPTIDSLSPLVELPEFPTLSLEE